VEPDTDPDAPSIHWCDGPAEVGSTVTVRVDWDRRWYHMQCHTAQHVISAVGFDMWNAPTVSWELAADRVDVDFTVDETNGMDAKNVRIEEMEEAVNAAIRRTAAVRMHEFLGDDSDGKITELRDNPLARGSAPEPNKFPIVRFVEIEGVDWNPCGGTHVRNLAELQMVKIINVTTNRGNRRVTFITGQFLFNRFSSMLLVEADLKNILSTTPDTFAERILERGKEARAAQKQILALQKTNAAFTARGLPTDANEFVRVHLEDSDAPVLLEIWKLYQSEGKGVLWLTSAPTTGGKKAEGHFILCAQDNEARKLVDAISTKCGDKVKTLLEGKGGGRNGKWQGKGTNMSKRDEAGDLLEACFKTLRMQ